MDAEKVLLDYLSEKLKRKLTEPKNLEYIFQYYHQDIRKYLVDYKLSLEEEEDGFFTQLVFNANGIIIIVDYNLISNNHTYRFGKQELIQVTGYVYASS